MYYRYHLLDVDKAKDVDGFVTVESLKNNVELFSVQFVDYWGESYEIFDDETYNKYIENETLEQYELNDWWYVTDNNGNEVDFESIDDAYKELCVGINTDNYERINDL